jgi:hypothetical protein
MGSATINAPNRGERTETSAAAAINKPEMSAFIQKIMTSQRSEKGQPQNDGLAL